MAIACVTLRDPHSPATAAVAVGYGFNCYQFSAEGRGRTVEVLWAAPDFPGGQARPSGSGIPIMFPFPGRIASGVLRWQGAEYRLAQNDGRGNAIHGFVLDRPWRVIEQHADSVVGEFHASRDDASLLKLWPADFRIRATYTLRRGTLSCRLEAHNPSESPLPCGFGTHPYFRVPLGGSRAEPCVVALPVSEEWELTELIPTGRRLPLVDADRFQRGRSFGEMKLDNVFTGLQPAGGRPAASIRDPESNVRVTQRWDGVLRECVVYTPPHREAICIEPLTCVPGAFDLAARGIDAGLQVLAPGGNLSAQIEISVE